MSEKIEKIKANVALLKKELEKIRNLYNQDGTIDPSEQQHLDAMMATIAKCEQRLANVKVKSTDGTTTVSVGHENEGEDGETVNDQNSLADSTKKLAKELKSKLQEFMSKNTDIFK